MANDRLTAEQADALLQLLIEDDDFRKLFVTDITAAFARLPGAPKPPAELKPGGCLCPNDLASPQQLRDARQKLRLALTSQMEHIPHLLEG